MSKKKEIKEIIAKALNVKIESIKDDTSIGSIVEWDSTGHLNIYFALEEHFNITIDLELATDVRTAKDWVNLIKNIL